MKADRQDVLVAAELALLQRDAEGESHLLGVKERLMSEISGALLKGESTALDDRMSRAMTSTALNITEDLDVAILCLNRRLGRVAPETRDRKVVALGSIEAARKHVDEALKDAVKERVERVQEEDGDAAAVEASAEADQEIIVDRMVTALREHPDPVDSSAAHPDVSSYVQQRPPVSDAMSNIYDAFMLRDWDCDGLISSRDAAAILNRCTGVSVSPDGILELAKLPVDAEASRLLSFDDVMNAYAELDAIASATAPHNVKSEEETAKNDGADEGIQTEDSGHDYEDDDDDDEYDDDDDGDDEAVGAAAIVAQEMRLLASQLRAANAVLSERTVEAVPMPEEEIVDTADTSEPVAADDIPAPTAPPLTPPPPPILAPNRLPAVPEPHEDPKAADMHQAATIEYLQSKLAERRPKSHR